MHSTLEASSSNEVSPQTVTAKAPVTKPIMLAHGILSCAAFGFFFPAGSILLRALRGKQVPRIHAYWQTMSWIVAIAGFVTGVYMSAHGGHGTFVSPNGHKQIGLVVIIIMTLQPVIGIMHHMIFKKSEKSTIYGYVHRFLGRAALIMGGINIGLGIQLGHATLQRTVAYSVITAFFFGAYFAVTLLFGPESRRWKFLVATGTARNDSCNDPDRSPSNSGKGGYQL
ncbi:uncharacterized protein PV09_01173 [Verruconis gallopava]|uniref:Cytochrome b561 domain-containing protein n=1 Tax=Verruconis gallopava TaxID=253628 RepID=A0A0D1XZK5_9PEZI|nr:uncharacterized protein PV09_01173 [Verruconis gallopava]KIW08246.1 hypothetical protein PV09_01173 [Verruconis gallopava]